MFGPSSEADVPPEASLSSAILVTMFSPPRSWASVTAELATFGS